MEAVELRKKLMRYIETADERLLNVVKAVVESYEENDIVAYTVKGEPLTRKQYRKELIAGEEEISKQEYTSQEDIEKESENW